MRVGGERTSFTCARDPPPLGVKVAERCDSRWFRESNEPIQPNQRIEGLSRGRDHVRCAAKSDSQGARGENWP